MDSILGLAPGLYGETNRPDAHAYRGALAGLLANPAFGRAFILGDNAGYLIVTFGYSLEFGGRDAWIDELYLSPEARGQGLGSEAIAAAVETCLTEGITALHLEVYDENVGARRLYERSGFEAHTSRLMTRWL